MWKPALFVLAAAIAFAPRAAAGSVAPAPVALNLVSIHMVTPSIGWGIASGWIVRTTDGGVSWKDVRPPGAAAGYTFDEGLAALGPNRAWVVAPRRPVRGEPPAKLTVFSTTDGGRSWHASTPLRGYLAPSLGVAAGNPVVNFVDARHGWVLTSEGAGMSQASYDLYRTMDGGRTLARVAYSSIGQAHTLGGFPECDCLGGISFRDRQAGWTTGFWGVVPNYSIFYRTADGGRTWHLQGLPQPSGHRKGLIATAPPAFFGRDGVLPAHVFSPSAFVLYLSSDGGNTWSPTTPIHDSGKNPTNAADAFALGPDLVWAWVGNTLYKTLDGGRHWQALARNLPLAGTPEFQFLNASVGYAVSGDAGSSGFRPYLKTVDGGRT